jgi:hypothetical protein
LIGNMLTDIALWLVPSGGDPARKDVEAILDDPVGHYQRHQRDMQYRPPTFKCIFCNFDCVIGTRYCFHCGSPPRDDAEEGETEETQSRQEDTKKLAQAVLDLTQLDFIKIISYRYRNKRKIEKRADLAAHDFDRCSMRSSRKWVARRPSLDLGDPVVSRLLGDDTWRQQCLRKSNDQFAVTPKLALIVEEGLRAGDYHQVIHDRAMSTVGLARKEFQAPPPPTPGKKEAQQLMVDSNYAKGRDWHAYLAPQFKQKGKGKGRPSPSTTSKASGPPPQPSSSSSSRPNR